MKVYQNPICASCVERNINETKRNLKFRYISILTNLLRTDNETKSVKTIYNYKKDKKEKE